MAHIFGIETVVTQFVHHYFVCREVIRRIERIHAQVHGKSCHKVFDSEQKGGFAYLVAVCAVLEMSDWADSEDDLLRGHLF